MSDEGEVGDRRETNGGFWNGVLTLFITIVFFSVYGFTQLIGALPRWSRRAAGLGKKRRQHGD